MYILKIDFLRSVALLDFLKTFVLKMKYIHMYSGVEEREIEDAECKKYQTT